MINIKNIENIVNEVTDPNSKFNIKNLFYGEKKLLPKTEGQLVEPTKEFKGVITDFVVNEFFPGPTESEVFIETVYSTFDQAIKSYNKKKGLKDTDIFFVYKGGNILRFVAYQTMHELGGNVSDIIESTYKDAFKKSDADFSIYIRPTLDDYDKIFLDMNNLAFLLQNQLRLEFMQNPSMFKYNKLSEDEKRIILQSYLDKLNETKNVTEKLFNYDGKFTKLVYKETEVGDGSSVKYEPKFDYCVDYLDNGIYLKNEPKQTFVVNLKPLYYSDVTPNLKELTDEQKKVYQEVPYHDLMISSNQTLNFWKEKNHVVFSLVRTKVITNAYFSDNKLGTYPLKIDGELIDVSITHKDDMGINHYFEHVDPTDKNSNVAIYWIKKGEEKFGFKGPSIKYLAEDIEKILFFDSEFPWTDAKYEKRIRRLLFLYFLLLLTNTNMPYQQKVEYLKNIQSNVISNDPKNTIQLDKFLQSNNQTVPFWNLIDNLKSTLNKNELDKTKLQEYIDLIKTNITTLSGLIPKITQVCDQQGIKPADITEGSVMWGGYESRYLKYKRKYFRLKHQKGL